MVASRTKINVDIFLRTTTVPHYCADKNTVAISSTTVKNMLMIDHKTINEFAEKLSAAIPDGAKSFQKDLEKNLRSLLSQQLEKMALVTREELDIQNDVLSRSREKLDKLELQVNKLEQQLNKPEPKS